ncbi:MAG: hypothetical protein WKF78_06480 [Candidatus Limnocylindrales bacterium]
MVGSGTRFLSGISIYTVRLANALAGAHSVSIVTLRRLLPDRLYPGRDRVGMDLADLRPDANVDLFDGIDWYWLPSRASSAGLPGSAIGRRSSSCSGGPEQSSIPYLAARTSSAAGTGSASIVEFHEVLDTGEARLASGPRAMSHSWRRLVLRLASGFAVHSAFDR